MKNNTNSTIAAKEPNDFSPQEISDFSNWYNKNRNKFFLKEKYLKAQKARVIKITNQIMLDNPDFCPKNIVLEVLKDLPDSLPPENLLKVVSVIVSTMQKKAPSIT